MVVHVCTRCRRVPAPFHLLEFFVLGPSYILFFTAELGSLLAAGAVLTQCNADDLQTYVHCSADSVFEVESCSAPPLRRRHFFGRRSQFLMVGAPPPLPIICRRAADALLICFVAFCCIFHALYDFATNCCLYEK